MNLLALVAAISTMIPVGPRKLVAETCWYLHNHAKGSR